MANQMRNTLRKNGASRGIDIIVKWIEDGLFGESLDEKNEAMETLKQEYDSYNYMM